MFPFYVDGNKEFSFSYKPDEGDIIKDDLSGLDYYRNSDYGSLHLKIKQCGKDEFKLEYYNDSGWNKKRSLDTDYIFTKDEVIAMIRLIKEKN